jgi:hypothetical protein
MLRGTCQSQMCTNSSFWSTNAHAIRGPGQPGPIPCRFLADFSGLGSGPGNGWLTVTGRPGPVEEKMVTVTAAVDTLITLSGRQTRSSDYRTPAFPRSRGGKLCLLKLRPGLSPADLPAACQPITWNFRTFDHLVTGSESYSQGYCDALACYAFASFLHCTFPCISCPESPWPG